MDPDTSDESKTVSPMCSQAFNAVEAALQIADGYTKEEMGDLHGPYHAAICELADEVRRLRDAGDQTAKLYGLALQDAANARAKLAAALRGEP